MESKNPNQKNAMEITSPSINCLHEKATLTSPRGLLVALLSAAIACSIPAAHAATVTWNGGGGDNLWTNLDNWGGTAPVASDPLVFDGTTRLTPSNNFAANTQFNGITFAAGAGAFTLSGNAINLGGNIVDNAATNQFASTLPLTLLQNTDIAVNFSSATSLTFGAISGTGFALTKSGSGILILASTGSYTGGTTVNAGTLRSTPDSTNNVFGSGAISIASGATLQFRATGTNTVVTSNVISGAGVVSIIGQAATAVQVLSGANTYNGTTTVGSGVLNIRNDTALGSTAGGTAVVAGAALQLQNNITVGAETLGLYGTGISNDGALRNISGNNTYGGLVTLGSAARINSDAGTLTLSNNGTITGATFGLTVGGAGNTTINSIIGTTTGTLTKDGAGTLTLTGANTYTGVTTVSAGTMLVSGTLANTTGVTVSGGALELGAADRINNAATLTLSGGTFNVGGFSETLGTLTLTTSTASSLDFVSGGSILLFSGITTGNGTLAISNWTSGSDSLRFTSNTNLLASSFTVNGGAATILNQGTYFEVVPEPATWALLAFSLTTIMVLRRRRA
ncbi:MAG: autotransporter-associated beta strand repeat-containing protein [Phycisphaerae bacterium]